MHVIIQLCIAEDFGVESNRVDISIERITARAWLDAFVSTMILESGS